MAAKQKKAHLGHLSQCKLFMQPMNNIFLQMILSERTRHSPVRLAAHRPHPLLSALRDKLRLHGEVPGCGALKAKAGDWKEKAQLPLLVLG